MIHYLCSLAVITSLYEGAGTLSIGGRTKSLFVNTELKKELKRRAFTDGRYEEEESRYTIQSEELRTI